MRKLMEYKIVSGRTVEIRRSWFPVGPEYRQPRGNRRASASSEKKIRANEKESARTLARVINCNFEAGDMFLTLKYDEAHYPAAGKGMKHDDRIEVEYQTCRQLLAKKYLPKLRREYLKQTGKKLRAVWVTANWSTSYQRLADRVHHHMVIPADAVELARKFWRRIGGAGTMWLEDLNAEGDYSRLAAYMLDNVHNRPAGERKWACSREMERPFIVEMREVSDVEDVQPVPEAVIKDVEQVRDEDGRTTSAYLRCTLPARPKVRGNMLILPRKKTRRRRAPSDESL